MKTKMSYYRRRFSDHRDRINTALENMEDILDLIEIDLSILLDELKGIKEIEDVSSVIYKLEETLRHLH